MKKTFISICFIFGFLANALYQRSVNEQAFVTKPGILTIDQKTLDVSVIQPPDTPLTPPADVAPAVKTTPTTPTSVTQVKAPTPVVQPVVPQGKYRNGSYKGSVADASYGNVQVEAIITNGKLSDVNFLSFPNDRQHSVQVSNYSLPILRDEAISAQDANVDAVSGASYTSAAFVESLSSALSKAS